MKVVIAPTGQAEGSVQALRGPQEALKGRHGVAICENGLVVWSPKRPNELIRWNRLRYLALTQIHLRYVGAARGLLFDCGPTEAFVGSEEEVSSLIDRLVRIAELRPVVLEPGDPRFPTGTVQAWERIDRP